MLPGSISNSSGAQPKDLIDDLKDHVIGGDTPFSKADKAIEWADLHLKRKSAALPQLIDTITVWWDSLSLLESGPVVANNHTLLALTHYVRHRAEMGS